MSIYTLIKRYNENKPVSASRDTQEIHPLAGAQMLKVFSEYNYETSILDDFKFYEQKQDKVSNTAANVGKSQFNTRVKEDYTQENRFPRENEDFNIPLQNFKTNEKTKINFNENFQFNPLKTCGISSELAKPQTAQKRIIKRINSTDNILNSKKEDSEQ